MPVTFVLDIIVHSHSVIVMAYVADDLELVVGCDRKGSVEKGRGSAIYLPFPRKFDLRIKS